jgi:hypothetical protein
VADRPFGESLFGKMKLGATRVEACVALLVLIFHGFEFVDEA